MSIERLLFVLLAITVLWIVGLSLRWWAKRKAASIRNNARPEAIKV